MNPNEYWNNLPINEKEEILLNLEFWGGFKTYKYIYLPDDLKVFIVKIIKEKGV